MRKSSQSVDRRVMGGLCKGHDVVCRIRLSPFHDRFPYLHLVQYHDLDPNLSLLSLSLIKSCHPPPCEPQPQEL